MALTIQSPGVEIQEHDLDLRAEPPGGTTVFAAGFTNQGPVDEILNIGSITEFEQIYGKPSNDAERYFYHNVNSLFSSQANVLLSRLPYGDTSENYSALFYPIIGLSSEKMDLDDAIEYNTELIEDSYADNFFLDFPTLSAEALSALTGSERTAALNALSASSDQELFETGSIDNEVVFKEYEAQLESLSTSGSPLSASDTYIIGEPKYLELTEDQYQKILNEDIDWASEAGDGLNFGDNTEFNALLAKAGMIILNDRQLASNNKYEGYYVGLTDNTNLNPATNYHSITQANALTQKDIHGSIPDARLNFNLSADSDGIQGSVSEVLENITSYDVTGREFNDSIGIGVFKIRQSVTNPDTNKLDYVLSESYFGSLDENAEQFLPGGGEPTSRYIGDMVEGSPYFKLYINPNVSRNRGKWNMDDQGRTDRVRISVSSAVVADIGNDYIESNDQLLLSAVASSPAIGDANELYPHGVYQDNSGSFNKSIKNISSKLNRVYELADNWELFPIDITIDGGLSTIAVGAKANSDVFDATKYIDLSSIQTTKPASLDEPLVEYVDVVNTIIDFAQNKRKDFIAFIDPLRHIFVQGKNNRILDDKSKNFSQHVYWPLRNTMDSFNSNYAATWGNWGTVKDAGLNRQFWIGPSGVMAAKHANYQPWQSAAGYERGIIGAFNSLAISPTQKQRDLLFKSNINPIINSPGDGNVVLGALTLQRKPSSFDRIITRRIFLYLEKATRNIMKYFVFRPNTLLTRTQVVNVLTPIFEQVLKADGLYQYVIICNERNNTGDVINRNELVADIYLTTIREGEKILVNFYNTSVDQNFSEIIS